MAGVTLRTQAEPGDGDDGGYNRDEDPEDVLRRAHRVLREAAGRTRVKEAETIKIPPSFCHSVQVLESLCSHGGHGCEWQG